MALLAIIAIAVLFFTLGYETGRNIERRRRKDG